MFTKYTVSDLFVFGISVGGGELFDRIIDENYTLMELDAVVFMRQICEGLQYMHKMSVLHLDLKVTKHTECCSEYCYNWAIEAKQRILYLNKKNHNSFLKQDEHQRALWDCSLGRILERKIRQTNDNNS